MNLRSCPSPAACWRQRFLAIARQAEAAASRTSTAGARMRPRPGPGAGRRPGAYAGRA